MPPKSKSQKNGFLSRIRNPFASFFQSHIRAAQEQHELTGISNASPKRTPSSSPQPPHPLQGAISRTPASRVTNSLFSGARSFEMRDVNVYGTGYTKETVDGWDLLLNNTAPNALHDSDARYDPPKCDEDTRNEVVDEIMGWIEDRGSPQRLLCMTGAAGSATDPTRNNVKAVIPTIAYQLGSKNEALKSIIKETIDSDQLIFSRTLRSQISSLIINPCRRLQRGDLYALPYAILIDGLDECSGEKRQAELLAAIKQCVLADDLPFRIFIASRPELAIRNMLDRGGDLHGVAYHIQLSDKYDATEDIRRYLWRRLLDIGRRSQGSRARSRPWPTQEHIELLVRAASGQFIYAATVVKYISEPRSSPVDRLKIVVTWTPREGQLARPFETLDILYSNILSAAKFAYENVDTHSRRDFLLLFRAYHINFTTGFKESASDLVGLQFDAEVLNATLHLEPGAHENLMSDLHSLVTLRDDNGTIKLYFYHKSLSDFLEQESRSKSFFMPTSRVHTYIAKCCLRTIIRCPLEFNPLQQNRDELPSSNVRLSSSLRSLMVALVHLPLFLLGATPSIDPDLVSFTQREKAAPNALHNSVARNTSPKCDECSGVVLDEITEWIEDRQSSQRLLCLTGPAGSGKSVMQQTIAERCSDKNILALTFFFSATDPSRNTLSSIVPTMALQLGQRYATLKQFIATAVANDPTILLNSLQNQMNTLIVNPFKYLQRQSTGSAIVTLPYVILIDALDECRGEDRQAEVLAAIGSCLLDSGLPFRIVIASSPGRAIRSALESGGYLHQAAYLIPLSLGFDASEDIRQYLQRRFQDIGLQSGNINWFTTEHIAALAEAASGQFIYAALIVKYVSDRRRPPLDNLRLVQTWSSALSRSQQASFPPLDVLFANILSNAKDGYEKVPGNPDHDFLLLFRAYHLKDGIPLDWDPSHRDIKDFNRILNLENNTHEVLIQDLYPLVAFTPISGGGLRLDFRHESFSHFLDNESRAGALFVPRSRACAHIAKCCVGNIDRCPLESIRDKSPPSVLAQLSCDALPTVLNPDSVVHMYEELVDFTRNNGWPKIDRMMSSRKYVSDENATKILDGWVRASSTVIGSFKDHSSDFVPVLEKYREKWTNERQSMKDVEGLGFDSGT
ncbi:hypothetical protein EST38_g5044 [Candolleomyces aberdarensis]|uniref:Nephrocystin 3-like N-terminal domain-containing protein n=1 Tax=Candolleomyces aberdarensis TaxID=2316362 RepID=A0A4Q2DPD0_9AGAR|nr:hypothetical protein EST38_g5044 [Candolleomyces aberdarensis]